MTDKALDVYATAANLRRWSKVIKIPSGEFFNEDLSAAADLLDNYAEYLTMFRAPQESGQ
jgi:hypothetical protein